MKLFIDANVLVAVLNKEYPLFSYAAKILSLGDRANFELSTSPTCIAIAFYFASKKSGEKVAKSKIATLLDHISLTTVDQDCTKKAIKNRLANDLEDGIQNYSAENFGCQYIITENVSDFYFSKLRVKSCEDFLKYELSSN
ncbi:MAG: twitching motility protein PilT [Cyclobacteriaceae bacterium]